MKRILICILLLVTFISPACAESSEVELFLLVEQGFLRVDTHLLLNADQEQVSFKLFPNAQLTAIWTTDLASYNTVQTGEYTLVTINLTEAKEQPFWLDLSYEGFLATDNLSQPNLDQNSLWFPLFDNPIEEINMRMTIPKAVKPIIKHETSVQNLSSFSILSWKVKEGDYPTIFFTEKELEQASSTEVDSDLLEPEEQPPKTVEEVEVETELETELEEEILQPEVDPLEIEEEVITGANEESAPELPETTETSEEVEEVIEEIEVEQQKVIEETEVEEVEPPEPQIEEVNYQLELQHLDPEFVSWVNQLLNAIERNNLMWLDQHIAITAYNKLPLIQFIINIELESPYWQAEELSDGSYLVKFIAQPQKTGAKLGLVYVIDHDGSTWKIYELRLIGLYP